MTDDEFLPPRGEAMRCNSPLTVQDLETEEPSAATPAPTDDQENRAPQENRPPSHLRLTRAALNRAQDVRKLQDELQRRKGALLSGAVRPPAGGTRSHCAFVPAHSLLPPSTHSPHPS